MKSYVTDYVGANGGGTANAVAYDDSSKSQVTLGGTNATEAVKLTNVAAGTTATDAVNFAQFSSLQSTVNNILTDGTGSSTYFNVGSPASGTGHGCGCIGFGCDRDRQRCGRNRQGSNRDRQERGDGR